MTVAVTRPLEEALSGILGLRRDPHPHRARLGRAEPRLPAQRRHAVRAEPGAGPARRRCGPSLPDGLDLSAERLTPSVFPMLQYELTGADPLVLRDLAEFTVRPRLAGPAGRGRGRRSKAGGSARSACSSTRPASSPISVERGPGRPGDRRHGPGGGRRPGGPRLPAVRRHRLGAHQHAGGGRDGSSCGESGPRPVRVADLGTRELRRRGPLPDRGRQRPARRAGQRRPASRTATRCGCRPRCGRRWTRIRPLLPAGVRLESVYDQAALVRDSMRSVRDAMLLGRRAGGARAAPLPRRMAHHGRGRAHACRSPSPSRCSASRWRATRST